MWRVWKDLKTPMRFPWILINLLSQATARQCTQMEHELLAGSYAKAWLAAGCTRLEWCSDPCIC